MMNCKQYVFKLTSGQLDEAGGLERLGAAQHRLFCRRCRAFTRNDQQLSGILADWRAHLSEPESGTAADAASDVSRTTPPR